MTESIKDLSQRIGLRTELRDILNAMGQWREIARSSKEENQKNVASLKPHEKCVPRKRESLTAVNVADGSCKTEGD